MLLMQEVVRISDRFVDRQDADSIDKQERLHSCLMLVSIFYVIMSIAFCQMTILEQRQHRHHYYEPTVVSCELIAPPPPKLIVPVPLPPAPSLISGAANIGGLQSQAKRSEAMELPTVSQERTPIEEKPQVPHQPTIPEPPTNIASNDDPAVPIPIAMAPLATPSSVQNERAASTSELNGGSTSTNGVGVDRTGTGFGGEGHGNSTSIGNGDVNTNAGGQPLVDSADTTMVMGNIKPYKSQLLRNLRPLWRPTRSEEHLVISIVVGKNGEIVETHIVKGAGNKADRRALVAVENLHLEPLPDWYKGDTLRFLINLDTDE